MECKYCKSEMKYNENKDMYACNNCSALYTDYSKIKQDPRFRDFIEVTKYAINEQWYRGNM